jgi:hypothetical protein
MSYKSYITIKFHSNKHSSFLQCKQFGVETLWRQVTWMSYAQLSKKYKTSPLAMIIIAFQEIPSPK